MLVMQQKIYYDLYLYMTNINLLSTTVFKKCAEFSLGISYPLQQDRAWPGKGSGNTMDAVGLEPVSLATLGEDLCPSMVVFRLIWWWFLTKPQIIPSLTSDPTNADSNFQCCCSQRRPTSIYPVHKRMPLKGTSLGRPTEDGLRKPVGLTQRSWTLESLDGPARSVVRLRCLRLRRGMLE